MRILAVDPGVTTGVAARIGTNVITNTYESMQELMALLNEGTWDHIIIEDFVGSGNLTREGKFTLELIGAVRGYCICSQYKLTIQPPQRRRAFQEEAHKLLLSGKKKFVIHEEDALAHLLRFEYDCKRSDDTAA